MKSCFIIASGPSILKEDLSWLRNEITIGCNTSYKVTEKFGFFPTFVCWSDPENYSPEYFEKVPSKIVVGMNIKYKCDNLWKKVKFPLGMVWKDGFTPNINEGTRWGGTVVIDLCIPLAIYLGFRVIYLIGTDCTTTGHAIPEYISKQTSDYDNRIFPSYKKVKEYVDKKNIKIINLTEGSKLDIFPRLDFKKFAEKRKVDKDEIGMNIIYELRFNSKDRLEVFTFSSEKKVNWHQLCDQTLSQVMWNVKKEDIITPEKIMNDLVSALNKEGFYLFEPELKHSYNLDIFQHIMNTGDNQPIVGFCGNKDAFVYLHRTYKDSKSCPVV